MKTKKELCSCSIDKTLRTDNLSECKRCNLSKVTLASRKSNKAESGAHHKKCCDDNLPMNSADCCGIKNSQKHSADCCGVKHSTEHSESCCGRELTAEHSGDCCATKPSAVHSADCCAVHSEGHSRAHHGKACGCGGDKERGPIASIIILFASLASLIVSYINLYQLTNITFFHYVDIAWIAVLLCGSPIMVNAVKSIRSKHITAAVLISTAIIACIALEIITLVSVASAGGHDHSHSYIFAAGEVAFLMKLGDMIEAFTVSRSRRGIQRMMDLVPQQADVIIGDEVVSKPLSEINIGDIVLCRAGDKVAVDGVIVAGSTAIDEAGITGESLPVEKGIGDKVFGGTFNKSGAIRISVVKRREDMAVSQLVELMAEAEGSKAPIAKLADKWAGYIVPAAVVVAILVGIIFSFIPSVGVRQALVRAATVLVVFCPCSLALATPTAIAAGIGKAASFGVMIKSGEAIERLAGVDTVCFDKTGTLTAGEIAVDSIISDIMPIDELLSIAAAAEKYSEHPIAMAIMKYARGLNIVEATDTQALIGVGVKAIVKGDTVLVLSLAKAIEQGAHIYTARAEELARQGATVIVVFVNSVESGIIALSDTVREEAAESVVALENMGVNSIMLTGDNRNTAKSIADACGIKDYRHSLLPQNKVQYVKELVGGGHKVCMVGDGINDAPALAAANCGIAMAKLGSDMAVQAADIALLDNNINKIPLLLKLARRVLKTIKGNIILAMCVNVVAVIASALGYLTPATGAIVHNCTSILVVTNSALILYSAKRGEKAGTEAHASK